MTRPENETELSVMPESVVTDLPGSRDESGPEVGRWRLFRHWLARGRVGSKYWVPRVGDRVRLHGHGTWLVYGVSVRRGEVQLGGPRIQRLADVTPAKREDLDSLYGTSHWYRSTGQSHSRFTPTLSEPDGPEKDEEAPRLHSVSALDDTANGHETELE